MNEEPYGYITTQTLDASIYNLDREGNIVEKDQEQWKHRLWFWHAVNEHWNYNEDASIIIEVYSNCEEVSLYHNNKIITTKYLKDFEDHIYKWNLPFKQGEIKAVGLKNGVFKEYKITSSGEFNNIVLDIDKNTINTESDSVVHIVAMLTDNQGNQITYNSYNFV